MDAAPPGFIVKRGARGKTSADLDRAASLSSTPSITAAVSPAAAAGEDTPFGFDHVPNVTASVASFQRRCEWFYVDPSGEEHGPVPLQKIINWQKKGHFPEDVKVRCRSPWFAVGALVRSLEEVPDADTPTAAALARAHGGSGLFHSSSSSMDPASSYPASGAAAAAAAPLPPPPPPPRPAASGGSGSWGAVAAAITDNSAGSYSSGGAAAPAPGGYEAELNAVFIGDASWGGEPVWYYIDRSDQVQGPFSAREMIAWVSSSMLKEDTKMCGAEAKLGIPPGRTLFLSLSELLAMVRRGEPYRPANLDMLRRKAPPPASARSAR